jgi:DNA-binding NtrC family response regulator
VSTGIGLDEENPSSIQSATSQHTDQRTQEFGGIVGKSALMQTVLRRLRSLALGDPVALLTGEPGTGKELMARTIHHLSSRRGAEFIVLDCGAIPHGLRIAELLGRSKEGSVRPPFLSPSREATLVLKEIGHLSLGQQTALVQALHDQDSAKTHNRHMGARVIATSSQDLPAKVAQQSLRADLFFRLNIVTLRVPALRDRRDDIPLLVQHFVRKYGTAAGKDIAILPETMMQSLLRWE